MAILQLGALRFAGLIADLGTLPIDATLTGAIFDATDTIQKYVFDGTAWQEFVSGGGSGEANTSSNAISDDANNKGLALPKAGVDLPFRVIRAGTNITLSSDSTGVTIDSVGTSPLTLKGDLYGFSTVDARLPVGTDDQVLMADSSQGLGLKYVDLLQTKGQLLAFGTALTTLPVGTNGQLLEADSVEVTGLKWVTPTFGDAFTSQPLSQFAATTSAQLAGVISDETGTGVLVFNDTPTLTTPVISNFGFANHNHLDTSQGGMISSSALTDSANLARDSNDLSFFSATTSAQMIALITDETGTGALVFSVSPSFANPALGTPASGVCTNLTGTSGITGLGAQTVDLNLNNNDMNTIKNLNFAHNTNAGAILDYTLNTLQTVNITGTTNFTTANRALGKSQTLRLLNNTNNNTLSFPAWRFVGTKPTEINANKIAILTTTCFGTADTDIVASYAEED